MLYIVHILSKMIQFMITDTELMSRIYLKINKLLSAEGGSLKVYRLLAYRYVRAIPILKAPMPIYLEN